MANITTANFPPQPLGKIVDENGDLTSEWNDWFTTLHDQVLGKNAVSDILTIKSGEQLSLPSARISVVSDGGEITLGNPQIKAGFDRQTIKIEGTDPANTIKLTNGTGLSLENAVDFILKLNAVIELHYNKQQDLWIENSRRV